MELIDNAVSLERLNDFLTKTIKSLIAKPPYDKFKIIHEFVNVVESYFSNIPKSGKQKKSVIIPILASNLGMNVEDLGCFIDYICSNKLIKKNTLKLLDS